MKSVGVIVTSSLHISIDNTVKPVLRGHLRDKQKVALEKKDKYF
jgi:hypothetical protein